MKRVLLVLLGLLLGLTMVNCGQNDATIVSRNLSTRADNFEIYRRVVFYNTITDKYMLMVEGYSSIKDSNGQLEVTVKDNNGEYLKHFLGLSMNISYFSQQLESANVSKDHYKVVFKPSVIIPNIEIR